MKKLKQFAMPLMTAVLMSSAAFSALAQNASQNNLISAKAGTQEQSAPAAASEQTQGYRDGMEAAKLDTLTRRKIDAKASHLYVHPPVKGADTVSQYRQSFEAGYNAAIARGAAS